MHVEAQSYIFDARSQPSQTRVAFFGSLLRLGSGEWLCGFACGQAKHHPESTIGLCRSVDGGRSWRQVPYRFETTIDGIPGSLSGAEMVETAPARLLLFSTWFDRSDPARPLFDPETEGILHSRQLVAESLDGGETWGAWRVVPTPGLNGTAMTGPVLQWADGTIAFAFESFKEFDDPSPPRHGAWLAVSRDSGRTFEPPHLVAADPKQQVYYWDQRLCALQTPGEYFGLFWTHDRREKRDRQVHCIRGNVNAAMAASPQPLETSIPGQIAAPHLWDDSRLLAFVVDRARPGTLRLWVSRDGGQSWPPAESLVVHEHDELARLSQGAENIDFAQYWEDMAKWSFGHPVIRRLDDRHVLLGYYAGTPGCLSIHAAIVHVN